MNTTIAPARLLRSYRPGFLFGPFGWLNERLSVNLVREPEFLGLLFELEPYVMHLLGIAIAHDCDALLTLIRQAPRALAEQSIAIGPRARSVPHVHRRRSRRSNISNPTIVIG